MSRFKILLSTLLVASLEAKDIKLLNVSYDPARELYRDYNTLFVKHYKELTGDNVIISQSHAGSGAQARAVIDGLKADVVTLGLAYDINAISERTGKIDKNWEEVFPHNSSAYTSTIVLLVRKGNPKNITGWDDLIREDVKVITPNPKSSSGARWNYLAIWGWGLNKFQDDNKAREFTAKVYQNVPILDTGARGSTNTFVQRKIGDVLVSWENEAHLILKQFGRGNYEIVVPSLSILAEPPVAVVAQNAKENGTLETATEYINYLFSPKAQEIIVSHYYRPVDSKILEKHLDKFPTLELISIRDFNGWNEAQNRHFSDGGEFDNIYKQISKR